jgi:hypothetical protein
MRPSLDWLAGLAVAAFLLGAPSVAPAQTASHPFAVWDEEFPGREGTSLRHAIAGARMPDHERSAGNHAGTGLLVGAGVGIAAAIVFLIPFCDDPDTECGADEVGRAVAVFTVPSALAGALVGSLIRKSE